MSGDSVKEMYSSRLSPDSFICVAFFGNTSRVQKFSKTLGDTSYF
jgi:hypothetical protein